MCISDIKEITPLIAGVIGAGATIIAVIVTSFFNLRVARLNIEALSRQKAAELKLAKLEELFFLFDKWQVNFSSIYLLHFRCYKGKLDFNQVLEITASNEHKLLAPGEAQKYKMIMGIYFPELEGAYTPVEEARKSLVPFLSNPQESKLSVQEFINHQISFEQACELFKNKVSLLAHASLGLNAK